MLNWKEDIFECVKDIKSDIFSLHDIYQYDTHLSNLQPNNNNINAKIRQQLQFLRNDGKIEFLNNNGTYKKTF